MEEKEGANKLNTCGFDAKCTFLYKYGCLQDYYTKCGSKKVLLKFQRDDFLDFFLLVLSWNEQRF